MTSSRFIRYALVLALVATAACTDTPGAGPDDPPASSPSSSASAERDPVIAAAGDIACDPDRSGFNGGRGTAEACRQRATAALLARGDYAAILSLGDNQYESGGLSDYRRAYQPTWGRFKSIIYPVPGNHEYGMSGARGYYSFFGTRAGSSGKGYYSFDIGAWHVVALNSNCGGVGGCGSRSPQVRWLRADLDKHRSRCTLAFWHHPRFSSGIHGNDETYDAFWRALYKAGADLVLAAHDHDYERFAPQTPDGGSDPKRGIREFVVGTGGRSLYPFLFTRLNSQVRHSGTYGILAVTLRPTGYAWRFVAESGETFTDSGSGSCH